MVNTFDSYSDNNFNMHVVLLWAINDRSVYGVCKNDSKSF